MRILGIDLKASDVVLVLLENKVDELTYIPLKMKKISLAKDETSSVREFSQVFLRFIDAHQIDQIGIRERKKKGKFAGGPISFKLEGVIQAISRMDVLLLSPQSIQAKLKKQSFEFPDALLEYQKPAYEVALFLATECD